MGTCRGSADFRWERKMSAPQNKTVRPNQNVMVLHQVKNWQNWKTQGCFMPFLRLVFVKKLQLQGASPSTAPSPHFSADFSIRNSHAWYLHRTLCCCHSGGGVVDGAYGMVMDYQTPLYYIYTPCFFLLASSPPSAHHDIGGSGGLFLLL